MLDLKELERRLDAALAEETPESLSAWLLNQRKNNQVNLESLLGQGHTEKLEKKPYNFNYTFNQNSSFHNDYKAKCTDRPALELENAA